MYNQTLLSLRLSVFKFIFPYNSSSLHCRLSAFSVGCFALNSRYFDSFEVEISSIWLFLPAYVVGLFLLLVIDSLLSPLLVPIFSASLSILHIWHPMASVATFPLLPN